MDFLSSSKNAQKFKCSRHLARAWHLSGSLFLNPYDFSYYVYALCSYLILSKLWNWNAIITAPLFIPLNKNNQPEKSIPQGQENQYVDKLGKWKDGLRSIANSLYIIFINALLYLNKFESRLHFHLDDLKLSYIRICKKK